MPRWTRWGVLVFVLYFVWSIFLTNAYLGQFSGVSSLVFAVLILGLVGLQVYRYRRVSTFRERQQTRWVVFGLAVALGGFALFLISVSLFLPIEVRNSPVARALIPTTVSEGLLLFIPISIAIAILRSRLYDIDTIINKALVYGLLTALLAAFYAGLVLGLQALLGGLLHQHTMETIRLYGEPLLLFPQRMKQEMKGESFFKHVKPGSALEETRTLERPEILLIVIPGLIS